MTNILELLKNEKVEWKKLGEVIDYEQPTKYIVTDTNYDNKHDIPVLTAGQTFILGYTNEKKGIFKAKKENPVIIFDDFTTSNHWVDFSFKIKSSAMKILKPKQGLTTFRYCYHYIKTINIDITEHKRMWISKFSNIEIPIPSPEIQEKIVEILDKFTGYVTELQSELQSRTKQYTYYRDMLLSEEYLNKITKEMEEDRSLTITSLGEIGKFTRGNGLQKKDFQEEGKPVIHYGQIYTKYGFLADKVLTYVNDEIFSKLRKAQKNDILIATTSENVEDVGKSVVWAGEDEIGFSGDMYSYRTEQNSKYIAYYFQTNEFQKQKERKVTGTKMIRIHADDMEKFEIPLPPLSLQNKIVKVLDKFQVLLEDTKGLLPEEIEQRQKQYEYYREKLLTFDIDSDSTHARTIISNLYYDILYKAAELVGEDIEDKVESKTISEIGKIVLGGTPKKTVREYWENGSIPWMSSGEVNKKIVYFTDNYITKIGYENSSATLVPKNSTVIALAGQGKTRGMVARIKIELSTNQSLASIIPNDIVENDYLFYVLTSQYDNLRRVSSGDGSRGGLNKDILGKYSIYVPPLHVQQHIVSILDKFDTLVNDIKEGLPKEIEQRQKQYEYWREQLLSFLK